MSVTTRVNISIGSSLVEKGSRGMVKAVSNSDFIRSQFPAGEKLEGWFYVIDFPAGQTICAREQLDFI